MQPLRAAGVLALAVAWTVSAAAADAGNIIPISSFDDTFATLETSAQSFGSPSSVSPPASPATLSAPAEATPTVSTSPPATLLPPASAMPTPTESAPAPTQAMAATMTTTSEGTGGGSGAITFNSDTGVTPTPLPAHGSSASASPTATAARTTGRTTTASVRNEKPSSGGQGVPSSVVTSTTAGSHSPSNSMEQAGFTTIQTTTVAHTSTGNGPLKQLAASTTPKPSTAKPTTSSPLVSSGSGSDSTSSRSDAHSQNADNSADTDPELSYACVCNDVRKVSLMSAADYCLLPSAVIGDKCGNAAVGEKGECPKAGAQPCQDTGHVLTNDSVCAYDKRDETYKCVASKEDLYIQKYGKAKKKTNGTNASSPTGGSSDATSMESVRTATQWVLLVASLVVGLVAVA